MPNSLSPQEIAHLQSRSGIRARLLVWIVAKDRETGALTPAGFWNGDDDQVIEVAGQPRLYHGAGGLLGMDDIVMEPGLQVRRLGIWLATSAPEVINAVMAFDIRLAPIEVHRILTDPLSHQIIAPPRRRWKGWVDGAPRVQPAKGLSNGRITIAAASASMALTKGLTDKYSDSAMSMRGGDGLFRYADVSGKVSIYWGEAKFAAPAPAPVQPPTTGTGGGDR